MTGIAHYMTKAGFVVTLVPMSVALYTGDPDTTANQVMRNEYVKYRNHTYAGEEVDLLEVAHAVLLQWYSGFDAGLCMQSPDKMACACNNMPDADYPNVLNVSNGDGLIASYWSTHPGEGGYMFPTTFPVRCQACGDNVTLPNGEKGAFPCAPEAETWFKPAKEYVNGTEPEDVIADHKAALENYTQTQKSIPYWWVQGVSVGSKCPRAIDCPDWRYEGEEDYSKMLKVITSIGKVLDISKVAIGFETMGGDVQVQFEAYEDPALPWSTVSPEEIWNATKWYDNCTQNMTLDNYKEKKRCAQPLLSQVWGPKFNASDIVAFEALVRTKTGKDLAGIGVFTVDGILHTETGPKRQWAHALCELNQTYRIPCHGKRCPCNDGPAPAPSAPSPAPAPSSDKYTCDWSTGSPTCKIDPTGWASKADCTAVCHA
jgi:hypothetical protein